MKKKQTKWGKLCEKWIEEYDSGKIKSSDPNEIRAYQVIREVIKKYKKI